MAWLLALGLALSIETAAPVQRLEIRADRAIVFGAVPVNLTILAVDETGAADPAFEGPVHLTGLYRVVDGRRVPVEISQPFREGRAELAGVTPDGTVVTARAAGAVGSWEPKVLPGFLSIVPPLLAILLAVLLRQVLIALFAGIWVGAIFIYDFNPFVAFLRSLDVHVLGRLADADNASIILFSVALGGMVGIIGRSGGTRALVEAISRWAGSRRSAMLTTWGMGVVVFFDDYANCLLVGNTVRPFTDSQRISREKLAYLVDSTAAPIASLALVSTWIGYELSQITNTGVISAQEAYGTFLSMLPYRFYGIFTLFFVFLVALTCRDFGPMLAAERRALSTGRLVRPGGQPLSDAGPPEADAGATHWVHAVVPVLSVVAIVVAGLYFSGTASLGDEAASAGLREIIGAANSFDVLVWAAFGGSLIALMLTVFSGTLRVGSAVDAWVAGCRSMLMAVLILVLAWTIGDLCRAHLHTGDWLIAQVSPSPHWMPLIIFLVSSLIALATGTSFGSMAIVIPIAGPMVWALTGEASGLDPDLAWSIRHATLAAVLTGAVYGDHCSPISDTTILSSMGAGSDHVDHVRTQLPYGTLCALVAALAGFIPAGFGVSPAVSLVAGCGLLAAALFLLGRKADAGG